MWNLQGVGLASDKAWINLRLCHQIPVSFSSSELSFFSMAWVSDSPLAVARCCHSFVYLYSLAQLLLCYFTQISWKLSFVGSNCPDLALMPIPEQFSVIKEMFSVNWLRPESHIYLWSWCKVSITINHESSAQINSAQLREFSHMWANKFPLCLNQLVLGFL